MIVVHATAVPEAAHTTHVWHLVEGSALVLVLLVAVGLAEHLKERSSRPTASVLAMALAGSAAAAVHLAVTPSHWEESSLYGAFFLVVAVAQLAVGLALLVRPQRALLVLSLVGNAGLLLLWAQTRTYGIPLGPEAGVREAVGVLDLVAGGCELLVVVLAAVALRSAGQPGSVTPGVTAVGRSAGGRALPNR